MSYIALYRKWRPMVFEDVVEQGHVVETLKNSVMTQRVSHAYLFCGTRGTGKTTIARIFARAINCLSPKNGDPCNECDICKSILNGSTLDVIEIDAASNNSVDNIREIRDEVVYAPSQSRYKVYIIDEVHMLSSGAFNALLKTLEEPPAHVVFFLATTEPHKLPATILSRCQRFDFRRITAQGIAERLEIIARESSVTVTREALLLIAKMSEGAMRDAISLLDQCISPGRGNIGYDDVLDVIGMVNADFIADMVDAVIHRDISKVLMLIEDLVMSGRDISQFDADLIVYYRNLLIYSISDKPEAMVEVSHEISERMAKQSGELSQEVIMMVIRELSALESSMKWSNHPRILLEVSLIKICRMNLKPDDEDVIGRLALLEAKLNGVDVTNKAVTNIDRNMHTDMIGTTTESLKPAAIAAGRAEDSSFKKNVEQNKPRHPDNIAEASNVPGKLLDNWDSIITELRNCGRMSLYTYLQETKAVELDGNLVGVLFKEGGALKRTIVSKAENLELLEGIIEKKLGRKVTVRCMDDNDVKKIKKESVSQVKEPGDELIEKAKGIAEKFDVPIKIIND